MSTQIADTMPPPAARPAAGAKRKREATVLDEDEWTSRIEAIIQRDFFPHLPKLQNKLEWLQAVRSGDPVQLQQAQLNIAQRRAGIKTPVGSTPAAFGTPGASLLRTPGLGVTPAFRSPAMTPGLHVTAGGQVVPAGPQDPSLDRFFAQHNSEDNKSFAELMQVSRERLRKAKPWLFKDHNPPQLTAGLLTHTQRQQPLAITAQAEASEQSLTTRPVTSDADVSTSQAAGQLTVQETASSTVLAPGQAPNQATTAADRPSADTDGFGTTGQQSSTLVSWPHTNKSALYYDSSQRDVVPWSEDELADMVQGPPKQIKHSATRFPSDFDSTQDSTAGAAQSQPGVVRGYGVLNTPSFVPGVEQSPLMTWGDIGSTPIRLDEDDDIHVNAAAGPMFKMNAFPLRDELGRGVAQKAALSLQRKAAAKQGTPLAGIRGTPAAKATPGKNKAPGTPLSAAGKRLLSNLRGGTPNSNAQLRASYKTQTPSRVSAAASTPAGSSWGTPLLHQRAPVPAGRSHVSKHRATAADLMGGATPKQEAPANLTDDLLKL